MALDFLTIAGTPYPVIRQGAGEGARDYAGSLKRAFDNTLINMTQSAKRSWQMTLAPMTQTQWETLDAATSLRQKVTVTGTAMGAVGSISASVIATSAPFTAFNNTHMRMVLVTVMEA